MKSKARALVMMMLMGGSAQAATGWTPDDVVKP